MMWSFSVPHIDFRNINRKNYKRKCKRIGGPTVHSRHTPRIGDSSDEHGEVNLGKYSLSVTKKLFSFIPFWTALILDSINRSDFFEGPEPVVHFKDTEWGRYVNYRKSFNFIAYFEAYVNSPC